MRQRTPLPGIVRRAARELPTAIERLPQLPRQLGDMLDGMRQLDFKARQRGLLLRCEIRRAQRNIIAAILAAAMVIALVIFYVNGF